MKVDVDRINDILTILANKPTQSILTELKKEPKYFSELMEVCRPLVKKNSGMLSYYLRKLKHLGVVKKDDHTTCWYLTNVGEQVTELLFNFMDLFTEYDMLDCNEKGVVIQMQRRLIRKK